MRKRIAGLLILLAGVAAAAATQETLLSTSSPDRTITVQAEVSKAGYLGFSAYPRKGSATHQVKPVGLGHLHEQFRLSPDYVGGTYEVALWDRQVFKSRCKTRDCAWCKANGFHMEGMRSYSTGSVGR